MTFSQSTKLSQRNSFPLTIDSQARNVLPIRQSCVNISSERNQNFWIDSCSRNYFNVISVPPQPISSIMKSDPLTKEPI